MHLYTSIAACLCLFLSFLFLPLLWSLAESRCSGGHCFLFSLSALHPSWLHVWCWVVGSAPLEDLR